MSAIATRHPAAERTGQDRPPAGPLRLTRRGRLVVVALLAAVLVAAFTLGRATSYADATGTGIGTGRPAYRTITVAPGQTLWQIARSAAPSQDPRDVVQRIIDLNGMGSASLTAGQELAVPLTG